MKSDLKDWIEASKNIDLDLIRDIVLFRQNQMSPANGVYDIIIKGGHIDREGENFITYFTRILIDESGPGERDNDEMTINMSEYLCLLRQKKLKEIGI